MRLRLALALGIGSLGLAIGCATASGLASSADARAGLPQPHVGCPKGLTGWTERPLSLEQAVEEARRVVVRGREFIQGRWWKRTRANQQVEAVVSLDATEVPGVKPLYELARRRCGTSAAIFAWAVAFHDSVTVMCCETQTVFVTATRRAVYVFGQL